MDLTTRAILLLGLIMALFAIAGAAVAIGRQMNRDSNGEEFDVGRNRTRRRKPAKVKSSSKKAAKHDSLQPQAHESQQVVGASLPPAYPAGNAVETSPPLPPVRTSATGPSPFGGAAAPPEEEW